MTVQVQVYERFPFEADRKITQVAHRRGLRVRDLVPPGLLGGETLVLVEGHCVPLEAPVLDGAIVHIAPVPEDPGSVITFAVSLAASVAISALLATSPQSRRREDNESAVYGYSGVANTRVEGQPVMAVYGRCRAGGQIVNEFTRVNNTTGESSYHVLISYGEGPIKAIGNQEADTPVLEPLTGSALKGVFLNGNSFETYSSTKAWVRLGTFEQEPIPGFEEVFTQESVDVLLPQEEGSDFDELIFELDQYAADTAAVQDAWTDFSVAYDLVSADYDGARVQIEFTQGLFRLGENTGSLRDFQAFFAIRYIELDSSGTPITSGGDNDDGYVYLPPRSITRRLQNPFFWEYGFSFADPDKYASPAGSATAFDGVDDFLEITAFTRPAGFENEFTVAGWLKTPSGAVGVEYPVISWGGASGFDLKLDRNNTQASNLLLHLNSAGLDETTPSGELRLDNDAWHHVAMVYQADADGLGTPRIRIYANGVLLLDLNEQSYVISGDSTWRMCTDFSSSDFFEGVIDDWAIWSRALTAYDVQALWNSGVGDLSVVTQADLVAYWSFGNKTGGLYVDLTDFGNDWQILPTSSDTSSVVGVVRNIAGGGLKRSKYRIEVLQLNKTSDSTRVQGTGTWRNVLGVTDEQFSYPGKAILGLSTEANEQSNGQPPEVESDIKGRLVPIWNEESTDSPVFDMEWSDNPAWVAVDMLLNQTFGAGDFFTGDNLNLVKFNELAAFSGEFIWDNYPVEAEPGTDWVDAQYSEGVLRLSFTSADAVPQQWTQDSYVAFFDGFPTPDDHPGVVLVDLNHGTGDLESYGMRIVSIQDAFVWLEYPVLQVGLPWAEGSSLSADLGIAPAGVVRGVEPRWAFNGVFDTFRGFWGALQLVLGVAQAVPVREGNRIGLAIDKDRPVVAQVTMGSTILEQGGASSFSYGYVSSRRQPNRVEIDILDSRDSFQQRPAVYSDPDIENPASSSSVVTKTREGIGITSLSQALRAGRLAVEKAKAVRRQGKYKTGMESLHLQPGDVIVISHDLVPRGAGGRLLGATDSGTVQVSQVITVEPVTIYNLTIRDPESNLFETKVVTNVAGTYPRGADITVDSDFTFTPRKDMEYSLYRSDELLLGEVVSRSTDPKTLISEVEWKEYVPGIYEGLDELPADTITDAVTLNRTGTPGVGPLTVPGDATRVEVRDLVAHDSAAGSSSRVVAVSWALDLLTEPIVGQTKVYARRAGLEWDHVATADRGQTSAEFGITAAFGELWEVAIQPCSSGGARRRPDLCARRPWTIAGRGEAPDPPTNLTAVLDGETAVYSWDFPGNRSDLRVELRRGGPGSWIMLPVVGISDQGATQLRTSDWANAPDNAALEHTSGPTIVARCLGPSGEYSTAVEVQFAPLPAGAEPRTSSGSFYLANAWEDFGDGWLVDSLPPAGNPTLTNLTRHAGGYLEFTGSSLTATYTAGETAYPAQGTRAERHYIEATLDALQVHPDTTATFAEFAADDPRIAHWTSEGPLTAHGDEVAGCTTQIQWRYVSEAGGSFGDWMNYRPCTAAIVAAQFRIQLTRPADTFQVRLLSFRTRITRIAPQRWERSPQQQVLRTKVLRIG